MSDDLLIGLLLIALFQVKHTLADYFMQTQRMLRNRSVYIHTGRMYHAGIHAAFTFVVVLIVGLPLSTAVLLLALDWVVHFHIDWLKGVYSERQDDGPADPGYWRAFGTDQMAHQLTYVVMVWLALGPLAAAG